MKAWLLSNLFLKKMKIIRYEQQIKKKFSALLHLSMSNVSEYCSINAYLFLRNVFY